MKLSKIFSNKTINFTKNDKTTLLVNRRPLKPLTPEDICTRPKVKIVPTKKIKICTGHDLKKMCRPKPCVCPPEARPAQNLLSLCKLLTKSFIAGSVVYWTYDAGIWGDSEVTEKFFTNMCHIMDENKPKEPVTNRVCLAEMELRKLSPVPPPEDKCSGPPLNSGKTIYVIQEAWNHTITFICEGIAKFPNNVINWYNQNFGKEPVCTPIKTK